MNEIPDEFPLPKEAFERQRALLSARVAHQSRQVPLRKRPALAAGLAFTVLGVLLVTPAFGIGGRILEFIDGRPAPTEVKTYFASNDQERARMFAFAEEAGAELHNRFSPVLADEARGVFAIESPDGPIFLWSAPTEDGRQCWLLQAMTSTPGGTGSCDATDEQMPMRPETLWTEDRPSVKIVHARIYDDAITQVDVVLDGAPEVSVPLVAGHALGTVSQDSRIVALVGRNADGDEVARVSMH
jgi:hypothetical protein